MLVQGSLMTCPDWLNLEIGQFRNGTLWARRIRCRGACHLLLPHTTEHFYWARASGRKNYLSRICKKCWYNRMKGCRKNRSREKKLAIDATRHQPQSNSVTPQDDAVQTATVA